MLGVSHAYLWVPNFHRQGTILNLLEQNRLWPRPLVHDTEKLANNNRTSSLGVKLTHSGNQHRPGDTAGEADNVGIDSPAYEDAIVSGCDPRVSKGGKIITYVEPKV